MTFRTLSEKDIELILSIQKDNFLDGYNKEQLLSGFKEKLSVIGLENNGVTVGLIIYSIVIDAADIEGVAVVSSERGKGYGKRLVLKVLSELKDKGVKKAFLEVRESNIPAINLYKTLGFSEIAVRKKYYIDGENAIVMLKELENS